MPAIFFLVIFYALFCNQQLPFACFRALCFCHVPARKKGQILPGKLKYSYDANYGPVKRDTNPLKWIEFISAKFFVLNYFGWFGVFPNKFTIFCDYTIVLNSRLSIIFCLCSGDIYLSFGVPLSCSFVTICDYFVMSFLKLWWFFCIPFLYYFNIISSIISYLSSG